MDQEHSLGSSPTGKLPYVTWQRLKRDRVSWEKWPDYAKKAYMQFTNSNWPVSTGVHRLKTIRALVLRNKLRN